MEEVNGITTMATLRTDWKGRGRRQEHLQENCGNLGKRRQRLAPVYTGGGSEKRLDSDLERLLTFQAETVNRGSDIKVWIWW